MKVTIINHESIIGKNGGYYLYARQMISSLSKEHDVSIITLGKLDRKRDKMYFETQYKEIPIYYISAKLSKPLARILSVFLSGASYVYENSSKRIVNFIKNNQHPDIIVLNHYRTSWLAKELKTLAIPMIYVTQNDEFASALSLAKAQKNWLIRLLAKREAYKIRNIEKNVFEITTKNVAITKIDAENMKKMSNSATIFNVIPPYLKVSFDKVVDISGKIDTILLIGSFMWQIKRKNAIWFTSTVFSVLKTRFPYLKLSIVGANANSLKKSMKNINGVEILSDVESVDEYYRQPSIFIVPEKQEGGLKIKSIQAAANGLPIVSTSAGIVGSFLEDERSFLLADNSEEMINQISRLLSETQLRVKLGANAAKCAMSNFSREKIEKQWLKTVGT